MAGHPTYGVLAKQILGVGWLFGTGAGLGFLEVFAGLIALVWFPFDRTPKRISQEKHTKPNCSSLL